MCLDTDHWDALTDSIEERQKSVCEHTLSLICGVIVGIFLTLGGAFLAGTETDGKETLGLGLLMTGIFGFVIFVLLWCFIKFARTGGTGVVI